MNGDPGSTQILTRHHGAKSHTVSQLGNSRTTPTSKSLQFSPFRLSKHLRTGSVCMSHHFLTTRMEPWGFIKSSVQTYIVHTKLKLRLSLSAQAQPRGLHGGHHHDILSHDHGGLSPVITPPNPMAAPTTSYEYLCYLPSSDWFWPPTIGVWYPGYHGSSVMTQ
jgi:hypothetical protein